MSNRGWRWVEDLGFLAAILIALVYGAAEAMRVVGFCATRPCSTDHAFPWGLLIICACLVLPKTVGRASAGAVWQAIGERIRGDTPK